MREVKGTTCYFTKEELREIGTIADATERTHTKIVQFAVRAFARIWKEDPKRAIELAQKNGCT